MAKVFEDLECWELAADLDAKVFRLVKGSDIKNEFSLRNQMLSSSGSIADNIAEGFREGWQQRVYAIPLYRKRQLRRTAISNTSAYAKRNDRSAYPQRLC
jgi:hypothetical protein